MISPYQNNIWCPQVGMVSCGVLWCMVEWVCCWTCSCDYPPWDGEGVKGCPIMMVLSKTSVRESRSTPTTLLAFQIGSLLSVLLPPVHHSIEDGTCYHRFIKHPEPLRQMLMSVISGNRDRFSSSCRGMFVVRVWKPKYLSYSAVFSQTLWMEI